MALPRPLSDSNVETGDSGLNAGAVSGIAIVCAVVGLAIGMIVWSRFGKPIQGSGIKGQELTNVQIASTTKE